MDIFPRSWNDSIMAIQESWISFQDHGMIHVMAIQESWISFQDYGMIHVMEIHESWMNHG